MQFALGYIAGIITMTFVFVVLAFFRSAIEKRITIIEKTLQNAGPKQKGFIIMPEDDSEILRKEIIEKNRREGKDTHISELL